MSDRAREVGMSDRAREVGMSRRLVAMWLTIILLLGVLIALVPRAESVESTLALRRFLAESGYQVSEGGPPPRGGTYVLLSDLRTPDEDRALLAWAASGGRLVVEHARRSVPAASVAGLALTRTLTAGDSALSFYRHETPSSASA